MNEMVVGAEGGECPHRGHFFRERGQALAVNMYGEWCVFAVLSCKNELGSKHLHCWVRTVWVVYGPEAIEDRC